MWGFAGVDGFGAVAHGGLGFCGFFFCAVGRWCFGWLTVGFVKIFTVGTVG